MHSSLVAVIIGVVVVVAVLVLLGRLFGGGRRSNPLREADSFANARRLTTQWSVEPSTSPAPVKDAPHAADTLSAEAEAGRPL